ncbi:MAG: CHASE2 domain-containing protein [Chroococcus sp. CMT-3BRIN-NPC107]|jgi:CHASE2 domain-containing sensor protein/tRNA A-37 threonylcarbamoyl transferase component Bud32|nr:CHASE2 domain-containing protein [Chroococcus sp. CMT-3BRIN-NPC107]
MSSSSSKQGNFTKLASSLLSGTVIVASLAVSALVIGAKQLSLLEGWELSFADTLVRLQPDKGIDPRLLVVAVDEEDIRNLGKWPASDRVINQLLDKLNQNQPAAIGLDIYRDLPLEPGNAELVTNLQLTDNIIAVCKSGHGDRDRGVAPPKEVPLDRLGFSDLVVDSDSVVRRNLLTLTPATNSACPAEYSFSFQLALHYLAKQGIKLEKTPQEHWKLGNTTFTPINNDTAEYQNVDARGYQVLLNYRSPGRVADIVNLTDVLQGNFDPKLVKDRVVLIGVTASSGNDFLYTPYSKGQNQDLRMPGVVVHAQAVSQILSAATDSKSLFWTMPGWAEIPWILVWSLVGGVIVWRLRNPLIIVGLEAAAFAGLLGIGIVMFTGLGRVPLVPPALALLLTGASVASYKGYKNSSIVGSLLEPANSTNYEEDQTQLPQLDAVDNNLLDGRYKVVSNIGKGGFGETYLAEDTKRPGNPYCVVKQLKPTRTDERFLEIARRFFNTEAKTLETVGRNDRIPQLLAYFESNKEFYLVQEYIKGHSLSDELTPGKKLSEPYVIALLKDVIEVLQFIHGFGVIHRDIKPGNIMRREADGRLVLIDFGAVKQLETQIADVSESNTVAIGTSGYAPPEQLLGQPVLSSDIYALGMIGIQALVGIPAVQIPKEPETKEVIWRDRTSVSAKLAAILDKMVAYRYQDRYQSAIEVGVDLQLL